MIRDRKVLALVCLTVTAVLAACGGGGGGSSSVPGATSGSNSGTGGTNVVATPTPIALAANQRAVAFSLSINRSTSGAANKRTVKSIDPNTQSITLQLLSASDTTVTVPGPVQEFDTTTTSPNCSTTNSVTSCTLSVAAPIGTDIFVSTTYSSTGGTGTKLNTGAVQVKVQANAANAANLTLQGAIQSVLIVSNNASNEDNLWNGYGSYYPITYAQYQQDSIHRKAAQLATPAPNPSAVSSERLFIIAEDANGNTIFNPTTYNQNIILTLSLNGGTANSVLTDTPPTGIGCPPGSGGSTSTDQGTVQVCSPFDLITLAIPPNALTSTYYGYYYWNFPYITATLPAPPSGYSSSPFPYVVQVDPIPSPSPTPVPTPVPTPTGPTAPVTVIGS